MKVANLIDAGAHHRLDDWSEKPELPSVREVLGHLVCVQQHLERHAKGMWTISHALLELSKDILRIYRDHGDSLLTKCNLVR